MNKSTMTVGELIKLLQTFPLDAPIFVSKEDTICDLYCNNLTLEPLGVFDNETIIAPGNHLVPKNIQFKGVVIW